MQTLNLVPPIGRGASPWAIGVIALHRLKPSPSHHLIGESRSGLLGFRMDGQLSCPSTIHHIQCHAPNGVAAAGKEVGVLHSTAQQCCSSYTLHCRYCCFLHITLLILLLLTDSTADTADTIDSTVVIAAL